MKIILDGAIGEEDLVLFARFLREMWRHRKDTLFILIEHGMENMTSKECQELFSQIFTGKDEKDWKPEKMTEEKFKEFQERMKK